VEGGEAGAKWSASGMEHGSEAHPGTSPTATGRVVCWELPECPKKIKNFHIIFFCNFAPLKKININ
jgi:hypothetical protein